MTRDDMQILSQRLGDICERLEQIAEALKALGPVEHDQLAMFGDRFDWDMTAYSKEDIEAAITAATGRPADLGKGE